MRGTGATPQNVTLSSSNGLKHADNIEVQITATAVNSVTGQWRINGGGWTAFAGATPLAQALAGTPYTLTFPNGTYTNLDAYRSVVGTILDDKGNVFDGSSAAANVRPYLATLNGFPCIQNDNVGTFLRTTTTTLSSALVGGVDTPFYFIGVGQYDDSLTPTSSKSMISFCDGSASGAAFWDFGVATTTGKWRSRKRADSGGTIVCDSATTADNNPHVFELLQSGTAITMKVDGTTVLSAVSQNTTPTVTCQFVRIGGLSISGTPPNEFFCAMRWAAHAMYSGNPAAIVQTLLRQNLKLRFGL